MAVYGVLLPLVFDDVFDYSFDGELNIGQMVLVSFGKEELVGVIYKIGKTAKIDDKKIKPIKMVFDLPPISDELFSFIEKVAQYNLAPKGMVLKMVLGQTSNQLPKQKVQLYSLKIKNENLDGIRISSGRKAVFDFFNDRTEAEKDVILKETGVSENVLNAMIKSGFLDKREILVNEEAIEQIVNLSNKVELTDEQEKAAQNLVVKVDNGFSATLLDGITGSGKTEVYFEAVARALELSKQVLVLVPEISLTTQWLKRFEKRFGVIPLIWHSEVPLKEKAKTWKAIINGKAKVVVGARSSLFLPYSNLGIIVVDESHDHSFKQESLVNYQGRDMAVLRAHLERIPIVLSTATPDLETIVNVEEGKYDIVKLRKRFAKAVLPEIKIIDIKKDKPEKGTWGVSFITPTLVDELKNNLKKGEQSMLFLNRRGYAPLMICRDCGHRIQCPHCTAWLAEHRISGELICHHCGFRMFTPKRCPDCASEDGLTACGPGVERIAEEVKNRFPDARVEILSSDITTNYKEISNVIKKTQDREVDILIGTQILAKGHNFPDLTLVGVIDADLGLMGSDLRSSEQTFQLLSQVAGRAGRGEKKGLVYLQTLYPDNLVLDAVIKHDRDSFVDIEKNARLLLKMPPYGKLAAIIVSSTNCEAAETTAYMLGKCAPRMENIMTLGPAPAQLHLLRGRYRYRLLLKTAKNVNIQEVLKKWLSMVKVKSNVRIDVDINPYSFM
ncbi:MAG: primosomal protein N' [Alphaproteobacteria bacterium]|nr:primosomal protein N' [Alphaproteobacteria bacterium]